MKRWIRRTLLAVFGGTLVLGTLAACASHRHGPWAAMSDGERAEAQARMVERIGRRLSLDDTQKARLNVLAQKLDAQHRALRGPAADPRTELQALIAGPAFDRDKAGQMLQGRVAAVQAQGPDVLAALADFYDSLKPEQQQRVREFLQRGRHGFHG